MRAHCLIFLSLFFVVHGQNCIGAAALAIEINPMTQVSDSGVYPPGTWFGFDEFTLRTNGMYGWNFGLAESALVTGLAWYGQDLGGLSHEHQVGLWQYASGSTNVNGYRTNAPFLFSMIIPAGTNAPLEGVWRKVDLGSPVELGVGVYVIAGTHYTENPDVVKFVSGVPSALPADPRILVGIPAFSNSGLDLRSYDPNAPLFRIPDNFILVGYGVELGPNLFLLPKSIQQNSPSLGANTFGNQIVLSWPLWATNFALETSSNLSAGSWVGSASVAVESGDSFLTTNVISSTSAFYRLRSR